MTNKPLDNLLLGYPCPVDWDSMTGDERKRHCKQCSLNVYNISDMSEDEANKFLEENEDACVRFYLREDGTIKTQSCARFIKVVRYKFELLKAAVSLLVLIMISACTGSHRSWSWQKNKWQAVKQMVKERYYNPDAYLGMAGRPTYSSLREAMQAISMDHEDNLCIRSAEEVNLLGNFRKKLLETRTIEDSELKILKDYYTKVDDAFGLFNVKAVEVFLEFERPITDARKRELGKELEVERQRTMDKLMQEAKEAIKDKRQMDAEMSLEKCIRTGIKRSRDTSAPAMLPEGVELWDFPQIIFNQPEYLVTTRDKVHQLIRLWEKVGPSHPKLMERKLSLELAVINKDLEADPKNELLLESRKKSYLDMNFLYGLSNAPEIKLARIIEIGDKFGTQNYGTRLPTKRVKLRTIESLRGDDIGGEFYFDYPIPKNFSKPDDRQADYRRAEEPLLPPEIGALKIVMLINPTGEGYRTHHNLNGVLVGTPENIARVKAVTEAQKRYFDDFYKLDPASKKYWEEEYKRQREAMVNPDSF